MMTDEDRLEHSVDGEGEAPEREAPQVQAAEDSRFVSDTERLIREAEEIRFGFMRQYRTRANIAAVALVAGVFAGALGFGWLLLVAGNLTFSVLALAAPAAVHPALRPWVRAPLRAYARHHKQVFMPEMARALGNMRFHAKRGISEKLLGKTGIVPPYDAYRAEDCFTGWYKGARLVLSEARLRKGGSTVFDGVFVCLEMDFSSKKEGRVIVSADEAMIRAHKGWKKGGLEEKTVNDAQAAGKYRLFTDDPELAEQIATPSFWKEIDEMSVLFEDAKLAVSFFGGRYVFIAIPYETDMFEPSNIEVPVTTSRQAMTCKREIEQILSVVDVLRVY